jgi:hypothetical protein
MKSLVQPIILCLAAALAAPGAAEGAQAAGLQARFWPTILPPYKINGKSDLVCCM